MFSNSSYNNEATGNDPCRVVEISNVNGDDLQDATEYTPEVLNDLEGRAAEYRKASR
jgi:hypothetical protein